MANKGKARRFTALCANLRSGQPKAHHKHKVKGVGIEAYKTPTTVTQRRAVPTPAQDRHFIPSQSVLGIPAKVQKYTAAGYTFQHTGDNRTNKTTVANTRQLGTTFTAKVRK